MIASRKRIITGIAVIAFLAINLAVVVVLRSARFKNWRADGLALDAMSAVDKADFASANQKVAAALQLSPGNVGALRAAAKLHFRAGSPQSTVLYKTLIETGQASQDELLDASESALRSRDFRFLDEVLKSLSSNPPQDARYFMVQADYVLAQNNLPAAIGFATKAIEVAPENQMVQISRARLLLATGDPAAVKEARQVLDEIVAAHSKFAPAALLILIANPALSSEERLANCNTLLGDPNATFSDRLQAYEVQIQLQPSLKGEIIQKIGKEMPDSVDARKSLGAWLVRQGELREAEALFPLNLALGREDYFLIWLDAVSGQKRWEDVRTVLQGKDVPIDPYLQSLFRGRTEAELGNSVLAQRHYRNAITAADRQPEALIYLAGYFNKLALPDLQQECLRKLANYPAYARFSYDALLSIAQSNKDTNAMLEILSQMRKLWPEDLAIQNDCTYLDLLLNRKVSAGLDEAFRRFEKDPSMFPFRLTYALALLRNGRAAEGLNLFENSPVAIGQLLPWQRVIFAALLAENGMVDGAKSIQATIPDAALRPEEIDLIGESLKSRVK